ncbi:hypothetical protein [Paraflavitalea sp. CAU 1676]|uniref:hypothetical protein n=1 Tax=Paraflavitalea sp. CAU 1676 TaxID=3032598 RepID=UPI0023DBB4BF|nr:hypothetical protein [Paraflavitalea sp. CAU 1676]MDF2188693.1 hypothetical protein [Paraflavitalea sp. CAU 1676]
MKRRFGWLTAVALVAAKTTALAGHKKFANSNVYADISGTKVLVANSTSMPGLKTTGTNQTKLTSSINGTTQYNLFTHDGTNYIPVYTNGF